jgi:hypothetical protein
VSIFVDHPLSCHVGMRRCLPGALEDMLCQVVAFEMNCYVLRPKEIKDEGSKQV